MVVEVRVSKVRVSNGRGREHCDDACSSGAGACREDIAAAGILAGWLDFSATTRGPVSVCGSSDVRSAPWSVGCESRCSSSSPDRSPLPSMSRKANRRAICGFGGTRPASWAAELLSPSSATADAAAAAAGSGNVAATWSTRSMAVAAQVAGRDSFAQRTTLSRAPTQL
jgi:hypothetical protein